jgi:glycosyltransferase involved in cell wall biosynthesis
MTPLATICIPTHFRLNYLKEAVAAARAQTLQNIEIIISDDGVVDEIKSWGESIAREDSRVRFRKNAQKLGMGGNWNACVEAARGEWIVIQGDDDRLLPTFCESLLAIAGPDSKVLFSNHYVIDEHGARSEQESREWTRRYQRDGLARGQVPDAPRCVWKNSVPMTASLIRADVFKRLGIRQGLNSPEIELFARIAAEGGRFDHEPAYLAEFRSHGQSATAEGLFSERLVQHLEPIYVPASVEETKRSFMEPLVRDAVDRLLRTGERARAIELMRSRYYPKRLTDPALLAQALAARTPFGLGTHAYLLARKLNAARSSWLGRHSS